MPYYQVRKLKRAFSRHLWLGAQRNEYTMLMEFLTWLTFAVYLMWNSNLIDDSADTPNSGKVFTPLHKAWLNHGINSHINKGKKNSNKEIKKDRNK